MLLWTFNIKAEKPNEETGLTFHYNDSDAGFTGDVRVYHRCAAADGRNFLRPPI